MSVKSVNRSSTCPGSWWRRPRSLRSGRRPARRLRQRRHSAWISRRHGRRHGRQHAHAATTLSRGGGGYRPSRGAHLAPSAGAPSSRSRPAGNGPPPSPEELSRALASLAPPTTQEAQVILKSVKPSQSLGAVGASNDLEQIGKDDNAEANRDYTGRIDDLIRRIQQAQNAQHSTKAGDVTEHAILEALESSIREANLVKFETFLGENWSPERLRVMILDRVQNEIGSLVRRHQPRRGDDERPRSNHQEGGGQRLRAAVRDLGIAGGKSKLDPVRAASLSDPWRSGERRGARERRAIAVGRLLVRSGGPGAVTAARS